MTHLRFSFLIPACVLIFKEAPGKIAIRLLRSFGANGTMRRSLAQGKSV
jgi:hypothetical protein